MIIKQHQLPIYVVLFCMFLSLLYLFNYGNREVLRFINYLFMAPILLFFINASLFKLAFKITIFLGVFYFIQISILPYADNKIILNQIGFLLVFGPLATLIHRSSLNSKNKDQNNELFEIIWKMLLLSIVVIIATYLWHIPSLKISYNHVYFDINNTIGVHKQYLGVIVAWFSAAAFIQLKGIFRVFVLMIIFGLFFGIRSFIFGYLFFALYVILAKNYALRLSIYFSILCSILLVILYKPTIFDFLLFDIRGIMLDASLNIAHSNIFGIGVGGVDEYLLSEYTLNPQMYLDVIGEGRNYSNIDKNFNLVESDFMQLLIVIGPILTGVYYIAVLEFVRTRFLTKWGILSNFQKYACIAFLWFIFAGFFEDYMGNIFWWTSVIFLIGSLNEDRKRFGSFLLFKGKGSSRTRCGRDLLIK